MPIPWTIYVGCVKKIEMAIVPQIEKNQYYYKVSKQNLRFPSQIDFKEAFKIHILHFRSIYFRIDIFLNLPSLIFFSQEANIQNYQRWFIFGRVISPGMTLYVWSVNMWCFINDVCIVYYMLLWSSFKHAIFG